MAITLTLLLMCISSNKMKRPILRSKARKKYRIRYKIIREYLDELRDTHIDIYNRLFEANSYNQVVDKLGEIYDDGPTALNNHNYVSYSILHVGYVGFVGYLEDKEVSLINQVK